MFTMKGRSTLRKLAAGTALAVTAAALAGCAAPGYGPNYAGGYAQPGYVASVDVAPAYGYYQDSYYSTPVYAFGGGYYGHGGGGWHGVGDHGGGGHWNHDGGHQGGHGPQGGQGHQGGGHGGRPR